MTNRMTRIGKHQYRLTISPPNSVQVALKEILRICRGEELELLLQIEPKTVRVLRDGMTQDLRKH